ncbi:hypothetical protein INS49_004825 [Diaporthe citri]|uniref:uncharacterized protein n=1 Tax=Diaporthe citri TaxID=83186 RepID=UPI001C7F1C5B|nr:uncharacterized protein INS49_004825 [Diaporthe citri]KAG6354221.1 hypothetical protein INS49_004825 [Diaporthe citri]
MLFIIFTLITATATFLGFGQATLSTAVNLARDDKNPNLTHIICKPQMSREARKDFTLQNIEYLGGLDHGGPDHGGPGAYLGAHTNGKNCERMSCQYGSGTYVCNDGDGDLNVLYATLAAYAQAVVDDPRKECNWHEEHYEGGKDGADLTLGAGV